MGEITATNYWTREEDKAFENAIAIHAETSPDRWEKIAAAVPGKSLVEVKRHYDLLVEDINNIEAGNFPLPLYASVSDGSANHTSEDGLSKKNAHTEHHQNESHGGGKSSRSDSERRKGVAWTEDEHRLFLLGLEKYGKGDWRSISRNFVVSRTPTQVASHAQKYFIRLNSMNKERRRSSIHDITNVNQDIDQGPITGQPNELVPYDKSSNATSLPAQHVSGGQMRGAISENHSVNSIPLFHSTDPGSSYPSHNSVSVCAVSVASTDIPLLTYSMPHNP